MARIAFEPFGQYTTSVNAVLSSGTLTFYATGTTTLQAVYSDANLTSQTDNPITLNAGGMLPNAVFLDSTLVYRVILKDSSGTTIKDCDPYTSPLYEAPQHPVRTETGTTYNVSNLDGGMYLRFTSTSAKTVTIRPYATHAIPTDFEQHIRNHGTSDLTIVAGSGVTINAPADGTLVVPQYGTVTIKCVGLNTYDLFGATVAA